MAITAQSIIRKVQEQLQDVAGVRWTALELVQALNDGQKLLVTMRPDLASKTASHELTAGAKQNVPAECEMLLEATRNTGGAAVTKVARRILDNMEPSWYTKSGANTIKHVCFERSESYVFYVYPPAVAGARLDLVYAAVPADVSEPAGTSYTSVTGNIGIDDSLDVSLVHYCLYWAFSKDAEYGGNVALAATNYKLFKSSAGVKMPAEQSA